MVQHIHILKDKLEEFNMKTYKEAKIALVYGQSIEG